MARRLLLLPVALFGALALIYYPQLPEPMAIHFGLHGEPNGFGSRAGFFGIGGGVMALLLLIFGGLGTLIRRLPVSLINIPHRTYWLAPERKDATIARLTGTMAIFGVFALCYLDAVFYLAIQANLSKTPLSGTWLWPLLASMGVAVIILVIRLLTLFRLPKGQKGSSVVR